MAQQSTEITDENQAELFSRIAGLKILRIERVPTDRNTSFPQGANSIEIFLEGGYKIEFGSWGYDAWGTTMYVEKAG
jgi:hypothetical protein